MEAATRVFRQTQTSNPRTVLAFYATLVGLTLAAGGGIIAALSATSTSTYLIPGLLIFLALFVIGTAIAIMLVMLKDPSKLMLGQVSGTEYAEIQQVLLGDSSRGERVIPVAHVEGGASAGLTVPLSLAGEENEEEEEE